MTKFVFKGAHAHTVEDNGYAHILEIDNFYDEEFGTFVRMHSWARPTGHQDMMTLVNALDNDKKIRVVVEIVDDI